MLHLRLWLLLAGMTILLVVPVAAVVWALTQEPVFVGVALLALLAFLVGAAGDFAWDRHKRNRAT